MRLISRLPVAVAALAAACAHPPAPPTGLPDPLAAGWKGDTVCERLHEDAALRVLRCTFPPGVGHERHFHAPHYGYAIQGGRARITDETGVREVATPTGTGFWNPGVRWHITENIGEDTSIYLIIEPKS
ncbi:cupin domain-containing protein [bacterium]|nr:cupin domain-containing protein [bacterium]